MADGEKPTSIWKKELSFRRKPDDETVETPAESGSTSIWKKELSLRKKDVEPEPELPQEPGAPAALEPDVDAAIAALALPAEPVAAEAPPVAPPPAPAVEHGWLTQPLEEISEPPADGVPPVALVPEAAEPVVLPIAAVPALDPAALSRAGARPRSSTCRPQSCPRRSRSPRRSRRPCSSRERSSSPRRRSSRRRRSPSTRRSSS